MYCCDICKEKIDFNEVSENEFRLPIIEKTEIPMHVQEIRKVEMNGELREFLAPAIKIIPDYKVNRGSVILCEDCQKEIAYHLCRMSVKERSNNE